MASAAERWAELKSQAMEWLAQGAKDLHNHVVPAFPTYSQGVDELGTPLNMPVTPAKPTFEETIARHAPSHAAEPAADKGMEL